MLFLKGEFFISDNLQSVFARRSFRLTEAKRFCSGGSYRQAARVFKRFLAFLREDDWKWDYIKIIRVLKNFKPAPSLHAVDGPQNCEWLRWATEDDCKHKSTPEVRMKSKMESSLERFQSFWYFCLHIVKSKYSVAPFTLQLAWAFHWFTVNVFYRSKL